MKDSRFFERRCFAIMSNELLEFMREQKNDSSLLLAITEDKEIYLYSSEKDIEYTDFDIMECVGNVLDVEINNIFVDGDVYCAAIYFTERKC